MRRTARWISIVLHPLFMPTYTLLLAFRLDFHLSFFLPPSVVGITLAMVFIMTALFPLASAVMLVRGGMVRDLRMEQRHERILPFLVALFYYALTYWLLRRVEQHAVAYALLFGAVLVLAAITLVSLRWKISVHMAGMGGLIGALAALLLLHGTFHVGVLALLVVLAGILGSARLVDGEHTPAQIYGGAVLGAGVMFLCVVATWAP